MIKDKIEEYFKMLENRSSSKGYMINREYVKFNFDVNGWGSITIIALDEKKLYNNNYPFDDFIKAAILEREQELINRAFELEEIHFQEIKLAARDEAIDILAGIYLSTKEQK